MNAEKLRLYSNALRLAERCHRGVVRKGTGEPYVQHPIRVAALLIDASEAIETVVAGLLHDTLEDSTLELAELKALIGWRVAEIVEACTEPGRETGLSWRERKEVMISRAAEAERGPCAVLAADKADNLCATYAMMVTDGRKDTWRRLGMSMASQRWYHTGMLEALKGRAPEKLERLYAQMVREVFENEDLDLPAAAAA